MPLRLMVLAPFLLSGLVLFQERQPIPTPKKPVADTYHGVRVTDDYRWLEDPADPAVKLWWAEQNKATMAYVKRLPDQEKLAKRMAKMFADPPESFEKVQYALGVLSAISDDALVILKSENDVKEPRVLLDPHDWPGAKKAAIDLHALSPDGKLVAVSVSTLGTEEGTIHVYETATGKKRADQVPQGHCTAGGAIVWNSDVSGFYYVRTPDAVPGGKLGPDRYARQDIWLHTLGTKADADTYVCGREFPRYSSFVLKLSEDGNALLIGVESGWATDDIQWYLLRPPGKPRLILDRAAHAIDVDFGPDGSFFVESYKDAPRGRIVVRSQAEKNGTPERVVVPQGEGVIHSWLAAKERLYVLERRDGSERLRVFDFQGKEQTGIKLPPFTAVEEMTTLEGDILIYKVQGFHYAPTWWRYDPATGESKRLPLSERWSISFKDIEVLQEHAVSKDGTRIPLTIARRKDCKLDDERPVMLTGYGGFRFLERPNFLPERRIWFDHDAVWAVAHPRGDADLGDDWHRPALGGNKQVTIDDFIACAEHLIARKYTRPGRLAIQGGSNGGLLIGMALTERPDLFAAAISDCGVLDLLRSETDVYGPPCIPEYGTVKDAKLFPSMLACSPYHRVKDGTTYPAVWLRTGANDRRVDPKHTWKMAARLQASGTKNPVLMTTVPDSGHQASVMPWEEYAFLFDRLGMKVR